MLKKYKKQKRKTRFLRYHKITESNCRILTDFWACSKNPRESLTTGKATNYIRLALRLHVTLLPFKTDC